MTAPLVDAQEAKRVRRAREREVRRVLPHLRPRTATVIRAYIRALHEELFVTRQELRAWRAVATATTPEEGNDR